MALGSTQPLEEISTRNTSSVIKVVGAYGRQTYDLYVPIAWKSVSLNLMEPSEPVQICTELALPLLLTKYC